MLTCPGILYKPEGRSQVAINIDRKVERVATGSIVLHRGRVWGAASIDRGRKTFQVVEICLLGRNQETSSDWAPLVRKVKCLLNAG